MNAGGGGGPTPHDRNRRKPNPPKPTPPKPPPPPHIDPLRQHLQALIDMWQGAATDARGPIEQQILNLIQGAAGMPNRNLPSLVKWAQGRGFTPAGGLLAPEPEPGEDTGEEEETPANLNAYAVIRNTLRQYGIDDPSIADQAWGLIKGGFGDAPEYVLNQLRDSDAYQAYFPELRMRAQKGLSFMDEGTILAYRDRARELSRVYFGNELGQDTISKAIGGDVSLAELEHKFQVRKRVMDYGDQVSTYFQTQLGVQLDDQALNDLFDPEVDTAEWDTAYEKALYSAVPAVLFGNRTLPENLMGILKQHGIQGEQAFSNYQRMAQELPVFQRLGAIDEGLQGQTLPSGNDLFNEVPFNTLFRAIQLGDVNAISELQRTMANETARFATKGGVAGGGKGLLGKEERARLG